MGEGQSRRHAAALAALVLAFSALPPVGAAPSASVVRADFAAVDTNGNGLAEYLNITLSLSPAQGGNYLVNVTLVWPPGRTTVAATSSFAQLAAGPSFLTLRVEGPAVSEKQLDGPFHLQVRLSSSPSGPVNENASFTTPAFRAGEFEPAALGGKPRLRVGAGAVEVQTPEMNVSVNLTAPSARWGPVGGPSLILSFGRAVAFVDDGDHAFEDGEEVCAADWASAPWALSALDVGPSPEFGSVVRIAVKAPVQFEGPSCAQPVDGEAALTYVVAERNGTMAGPLPGPLIGGLELKVDARMNVSGRLPGTDIAFEVGLRAEGAVGTFVVRSAAGYASVDPSAGDAPAAPLAAGAPADIERVSFVNATGAVLAYFAWMALADETLNSGQVRYAQVSASQGASNGTFQLYLAAPSGANLTALGLDPIAGVAQNAAPPPLGAPPTPPPPALPSALVFVGALAAVAAMFFFSVYARAKKY